MRTLKLVLMTVILWLAYGAVAVAAASGAPGIQTGLVSDRTEADPAPRGMSINPFGMTGPAQEAGVILLAGRRPVANKTQRICLSNNTRTTNNSLRCATRLIEARPEQNGQWVKDPVQEGYRVSFPASYGTGYNRTCREAIIDVNRPITFKVMVRTILDEKRPDLPYKNKETYEWFRPVIKPPYGATISVGFYPDCSLRRN